MRFSCQGTNQSFLVFACFDSVFVSACPSYTSVFYAPSCRFEAIFFSLIRVLSVELTIPFVYMETSLWNFQLDRYITFGWAATFGN